MIETEGMMLRTVPKIILVLVVAVAGCAPVTPLWRSEAVTVLARVNAHGASKEFPAEFESAVETLKQCEELLQDNEVEEADDCFRFVWTKGEILEKSLAALKARREEEARLRAESERREAERLRLLREEEARSALLKKESVSEKAHEKSKQVRDKPLLESHTVKRGETLPQIAAMADVYNDYRLWPLLYRANRDQIRDPKHVWPGQILRIPRNLSREEITEARRYSLEKPIQ